MATCAIFRYGCRRRIFRKAIRGSSSVWQNGTPLLEQPVPLPAAASAPAPAQARVSGDGLTLHSEVGGAVADWALRPTGDRVDCRLTLRNPTQAPVLLQVETALPVPFKSFRWWNGYDTEQAQLPLSDDFALATYHGPNEVFPANAALEANAPHAVALALAPDTIISYMDHSTYRKDGRWFQSIRTRHVLAPGAELRLNGVAFAVNAPCGWPDVVEQYWALYPEQGLPRAGLHPGMNGRGASYCYWHFSYKGDEHRDLVRRFNAGWEWGYNPSILNGDWALSEKYSLPAVMKKEGRYRHLPDLSNLAGRQRYDAVRDWRGKQMSRGLEAGVCPCFYTLPCHAEPSFAEKDFADALLTLKHGAHIYMHGVRLFPAFNRFEPWLKAGLADVVEQFGAPGLAFDSLFGNLKHYGKLNDTFASAFDDDLETYALDGAAESVILRYCRTLTTKDGKPVGLVGNTKLVAPFYTQAFLDHGLIEYSPVTIELDHRQARIVRLRNTMNRKNMTFWHQNFYVRRGSKHFRKMIEQCESGKMSLEDFKIFLLKARDRARVYCYYYVTYMSAAEISGIPKLMKATPALDAFILRGRQPSPNAMATHPDALLSRTGLGRGQRGARSATWLTRP